MGTFVAGSAALLVGKESTTNIQAKKILPAIQAKESQHETAVDGKYYTAGPAIGSYEVALDFVASLYGNESASYIETTHLEYGAHPLFNVGSPHNSGFMLNGIDNVLAFMLHHLYKKKVKLAFSKYSR